MKNLNVSFNGAKGGSLDSNSCWYGILNLYLFVEYLYTQNETPWLMVNEVRIIDEEIVTSF